MISVAECGSGWHSREFWQMGRRSDRKNDGEDSTVSGAQNWADVLVVLDARVHDTLILAIQDLYYHVPARTHFSR
jgi:hypothetical protein